MQRLLASYRAIPQAATVRLAKPTSNLFRACAKSDAKGLDVSGLTGVVSVDADASTADVAGMCTYEDLVAATLPYGLSPLVVPQLKTITLGGAVTGLGIESTSFRNGLPHESVLEMDILTGTGEVVTASPDQNADLYRAFPNSYGTLGYSVRLKIELEPVKPFVVLRHLRFHSLQDLVAALDRIIETGGIDGTPVDYLDGVVFSGDESYLCVGVQTATPGPVSDYTDQRIYYRSIQHDGPEKHDRLTIHDYLWRWDTDWFWCSRAFGAQNPVIRRLWPGRYRRSDVYRRIVALDHRYGFSDRLNTVRKRPVEELVVQDVEIPVRSLPAFLEAFHRDIGISPLWLCPLRLQSEKPWTLYPMKPGELYVNVGFWSSVPQSPGEPDAHNRRIEQLVSELDGHKSLYSTVHYAEDEFWRHYNGPAYRALKQRYDPRGRLPDLYSKVAKPSSDTGKGGG